MASVDSRREAAYGGLRCELPGRLPLPHNPRLWPHGARIQTRGPWCPDILCKRRGTPHVVPPAMRRARVHGLSLRSLSRWFSPVLFCALTCVILLRSSLPNLFSRGGGCSAGQVHRRYCTSTNPSHRLPGHVCIPPRFCAQRGFRGVRTEADTPAAAAMGVLSSEAKRWPLRAVH